jgi:uncharacterized SAM-binding protein YcdF (DUF218 family)
VVTVIVRVLVLLAGAGGLMLLAVIGYGSASRRRAFGTADHVVVLGSTLNADGAVSAVLAARLDKAREVAAALRGRGGDPVLVVSGGRTARDPATEAGAMAEYLAEAGEDATRMLVEDQSRTTKENLRRTRELLRDRGAGQRCVIVSSDYHCLRIALLARQNGLSATVVGAPTPRRQWPVAVLRDLAALLVTWWPVTVPAAIAVIALGVAA